MDNIIFIGMPAAGKSTVGVVAAKRLGYGFLDVDLLIQEKEKKLLHEIIEERGTEGFRPGGGNALHHLAGRERSLLPERHGAL